jgi:uncharacterized protein
MARYKELTTYLKKYNKAIIAFSGGIDSYLVLKASLDALGKENVLAVTGESPSLKQSEKQQTNHLAEQIGTEHKIIHTEEMDNTMYTSNPVNRCFYCKDELYTKLDKLKTDSGFDCILDGTNYDDMSDYRPGFQAASIHHITSPLAELKFTKNEIRKIAKSLNLEIWDKPASPCLSSRIPYGQVVTIEKLSIIEKAEEIIKNMGFTEFRVRLFEMNKNGNDKSGMRLAKVDISTHEIDKVLNRSVVDAINEKLKDIGFDFVTLDLGGLKSGSLNTQISKSSNQN